MNRNVRIASATVGVMLVGSILSAQLAFAEDEVIEPDPVPVVVEPTPEVIPEVIPDPVIPDPEPVVTEPEPEPITTEPEPSPEIVEPDPVVVEPPDIPVVETVKPPKDTTDKKIGLCHNGHWINPSVASFFNAGHPNHSDDIWPAFDYWKHGEQFFVEAQGDQSLLETDCVPQPEPLVEEYEEEWPDWYCGDKNVTWTKEVWLVTTPYKYTDEGWVLDYDNATQELISSSVYYEPLTEEEITFNCSPDPYVDYVEKDWKDGKYKCGDTKVKQTKVYEEYLVQYYFYWLDDGAYEFRPESTLINSTKDYRYRELKSSEIKECPTDTPTTYSSEPGETLAFTGGGDYLDDAGIAILSGLILMGLSKIKRR